MFIIISNTSLQATSQNLLTFKAECNKSFIQSLLLHFLTFRNNLRMSVPIIKLFHKIYMHIFDQCQFPYSLEHMTSGDFLHENILFNTQICSSQG